MEAEETQTFVEQTFVDDDDVETSIVCGEQEQATVEGDKENTGPTDQRDDEDEDEDPVVDKRPRRRHPRARPVLSDSEEDEDYGDALDVQHAEDMVMEPPQSPSKMMPPPPLMSSRPPHRKGHSTISNWAQDVIDLTDTPDPQTSFVLPPPARARSASFAASSRASNRMSSRAEDILV